MRNHTSTYVVSTDLTQEVLAETPTAAPAARKRLFFMSWNAGGGARQLPTDVLEEKAYEFFAIQEAHVEQMRQLGTTHNFVFQENQCIVALFPHEVELIAHKSTNMISWLVAEIYFEQPHLGLTSLVVMSINLSCKHAKRVSGLSTLADALDAAMLDCLHAGRPSLDIVCGNINMAPPPLSCVYKCPSRASAAPAASSRAAAPRCSSAPLLLCDLACCVVLPSLLSRCAAFPRLERIEPSVVEGRHLRCL